MKTLNHFLGTLGVVIGILGSPLVSGLLPAKAAAIIAAVAYGYKQITDWYHNAFPQAGA